MSCRRDHARRVSVTIRQVLGLLATVSGPTACGGSDGVTEPPTPPSVASVQVSPSQLSLPAGETRQLSVTLRDAAGSVLTGRSVMWSSSDGDVATVDLNGLVTAVAIGAATITATSERKTGSAAVAVQIPAVNNSDDVDDGSCNVTHCSFREALSAANRLPGLDTIAFNIPGAGPHTIQPASALPSVTDPVVIDGYTQQVPAPTQTAPELASIPFSRSSWMEAMRGQRSMACT